MIKLNPFEIGQRVAYRREFLQSIGAHTGWAPFARGRIDRVEGTTCLVEWDDAPATNVNSANLVLESKLHLENP